MVLRLRAAMPAARQELASTALRELRARKSPAEVAALLAAGEAIDSVHAQVPGWLRPGRTEREVAADISDAILAAGHVTVDFAIVASGPNGASPHHTAADRVLQPGDAVVVDIGGTMPSGYCSDCTRTYAIGDPPAEFVAYYQVLKDAQEAACAAVRPGIPAEAIDAAAREPIAAAGYGEYFVHRTGHGIGLETHEDPYIVSGNSETLQSGNAFSVEPGIYPGPHGARIEDIVVCTEAGAQRLNNRTRELVVVARLMPGVQREARDDTAAALFGLVRDLADGELRPRVADAERDSRFPRAEFTTIGQAGLLGLPYPEEIGGGGQPYETYLQVVEELATAWLAVGLGVSVHTLACFPIATAGSPEQRDQWLADMLGGGQLGAYCLSEPASGSDAAALRTRAAADGDEYVVDGVKAWITHGGHADFYTLFARTSGDHDGPDRSKGISCFHVPAGTPGVEAAPAEHKMGMRSSATAQMRFDSARVPAAQLVGEPGYGFRIALAALDAGRLGIAACATGVAQAALDCAVQYARQRSQFGRPIIDFQGLQFMLADMATSVAAARALYLAAARRKDAGKPYGQEAAMAKLLATDNAMKVTTDAVQVLGGYGYVEDFPAERLMREAKVLQIVEGTNQVQRMVIGRQLAGR